uniref:Uncharacterized protein n=1 Tax=viral metagenome TaxID=1070528 RepID=A0A6M3XVB8_9ZZZZ
MKTRDAVLLYEAAQADTDTKILDIDLADPISAFYIEVRSTNGATSNKGNYISDIVTKIEVVDGSEVFHSLNMFQEEAMCFYKTGKVPVMFPSEWPSGIQRHGVYLLFGHYLWDPTLCFVPTSYKNPQLKITFNKAKIRAAGTDGFATGDNILLTVVAKVIEEGASPMGFLMQKQIESFTAATSGDKRIELPTDYPYSMILCRFWLTAYDIDLIIEKLKLTCDTDKFIPFDRYVKQLDAEAFAMFGASRLKHDIFTQNHQNVRLLNNKEPDCRVWGSETGLDRIINTWYQWGSQLRTRIVNHDGIPVAADERFTMVEEGHALHSTLPVLFGIYGNPGDYFPAPNYGKVELVLSQIAAGLCEIVLEQKR